MKIEFNSDDDLLLNKTLEHHNFMIVFLVIFPVNCEYYLKVFLDECSHKL